MNRKHGTRPDNRWHGPFASREEALVKLRELNKRDAGVCQHCLG